MAETSVLEKANGSNQVSHNDGMKLTQLLWIFEAGT